MKFFQASLAAVVTRFYLMIAVALIAGFAGAPWLGLLCIPIFLSAMLGIKVDYATATDKVQNTKSIQSRSTRNTIGEAA